jgi:protein TonB
VTSKLKPDEQAVPAPTKKPEAETYSEEKVAQRIAQMRAKMEAAHPEPSPSAAGEAGVRKKIEAMRERAEAEGSGGPEPSGPVGIRGGGHNVLQQVRLRAYYNRLWEHVHGHWAVPPSLKNKLYTVIVSVVIDRQGRLLKSWVEESSGSDAFDQSALNALGRAQPLPPVPESVPDVSLEVGFRFHGE